MSHQSRRRRSYGRRQHELAERRDRRDRLIAPDEPILELDGGLPGDGPAASRRLDLVSDRMGWLEGRS